MNFVRSRLVVGNLMGQWRRQVTHTQNRRMMCIKPQETKAESQPAVPAHDSRLGFRVPGHKPSNLDKRMLVWSGRFKTADQIPELVSFEMIAAARSRMRLKACYIMMAASIGVAMVMVFLGKRAAGRHESLTRQNTEKKARWREEFQREKEAAAALAAKTQ